MFGMGFQELLLILLICLLIFGASRLPEIGRSIGKALQEFKKGMQGAEENSENKTEEKK